MRNARATKTENFIISNRAAAPAMNTIRERIESRKTEHLGAALDVLFTPWQTQILTKLAKGDTLTNAERQELSRKIKPKLLAIESLQNLKLLHPFYDL